MTSPAEHAHQAWQALKARCCTNPQTAARIVQLSESEFRAVMVPLLERVASERERPPDGYLKARQYWVS